MSCFQAQQHIHKNRDSSGLYMCWNEEKRRAEKKSERSLDAHEVIDQIFVQSKTQTQALTLSHYRTTTSIRTPTLCYSFTPLTRHKQQQYQSIGIVWYCAQQSASRIDMSLNLFVALLLVVVFVQYVASCMQAFAMLERWFHVSVVTENRNSCFFFNSNFLFSTVSLFACANVNWFDFVITTT